MVERRPPRHYVDHIARLRGAPADQTDDSRGDEGTTSHCGWDALLRDLDDSVATTLFRREQLQDTLRRHLTDFWKHQAVAESAWKPCGLKEFRACAWRLLGLNKQSALTSRSVQFWFSVRALRREKEKASVDNEGSFAERQENRLEFWAKYRSKLDKSELPLARKLPAKGQGVGSQTEAARGQPAAREALVPGGAPMETRGDFWQAAIRRPSVGPSVSPRGKWEMAHRKIIHRRTAEMQSPTEKAQSKKEKSKKLMSWTRRATRDTRGFSDVRWAMGQHMHLEHPEEDEDEEEGDVQLENQIGETFITEGGDKESEEIPEKRRILRLLPDVAGGAGARLVFAKEEQWTNAKKLRQDVLSSDNWQSQIASVVAEAREEVAETKATDTEYRTWNLSGLNKGLHQSKSCIDLLHGPRAGAMGRKSVSLPSLTQRGVVTSMYRPRANIKSRATLAPLPPIMDVFKESEHSKKAVMKADVSATTTKRYVKVCQKFGVLPTPMACVTGQSAKLDASDRALTDEDLLAFAAVLRSMARIEEVDLNGNTLLTEKALVAFLSKLFGPPASSSLEKLNLRRCVNAGRMSLEIVVQLMEAHNGLLNLRHLDLSGVPIAVRSHLPLATAVCEHPCLTSLSLADTGLGSSPVVKQCVAQILGSTTVETLDLSWNPFNTDVFAQLGEVLVETQALRSLRLANCSGASLDPAATPVMFFLEHLAHDRTLEFLDLSLNRIDFRSALVIEDVLQCHNKLETINITQNALGVLGMRSFLRLLSRDSSGLVNIAFDSCHNVSEPLKGNDIFRVGLPNGRYTLDLTQPYNRSILRMLYKTCERLQISPRKSLEVIDCSVSPYKHPARKDSAGVWPVLKEGTLVVRFCPLAEMVDVKKSAQERLWRPGFDEFVEKLKLQLGLRKMVPLLVLWKSIEGCMQQQNTVLQAISRDFVFSYPQMEQICQGRLFASQAISQLFHCVSGGDAGRYLCGLLSPTLSEQVGIYKKVSKFMDLNIENPTGHYALDLQDSLDVAIAERLFLLDLWEIRLSSSRGAESDTSQRGNLSQFRNEQHDNCPVSCQTLSDWCLPSVGILEFDYVTTRRPQKADVKIALPAFQKVLLALRESTCDPMDQVLTLRRVSADIFLSSRQLRQMMMETRENACLDELVVMFYFRIVDIWNDKVFRVRCPDWRTLQRRLGHVNVFPFFQVENCEFDLDFCSREERLTASILVTLTNKEPNGTYKRRPQYVSAEGADANLELGVPRLWENFSYGIPSSGVFTATFLVTSEYRNFKERRRLCKQFGRWHVSIDKAKEITRWADLSALPKDVIAFLAGVVGRYKDAASAFHAIDGIDGNGAINLGEFEENCAELGVFNGNDQRARAVAMFRFLDSGGTGQITYKEWSELELYWQELGLSILEYTQCVSRGFNGNLVDAWHELDEDGNGELDIQEWCQAADKFHYHGPATTIFQFLDKDGKGIVTLEKFLALKNNTGQSLHHRKAVNLGGINPDMLAALQSKNKASTNKRGSVPARK